MENTIKVGITQGDFNGIGLEVTLKALADETILELLTPVLFADWRLVEYARKSFGLEIGTLDRVTSASEAREGRINVVDLRLENTVVEAGAPTEASGAGAVASLEAAVSAVLGGEIDVLVTAPISKEAVQCDIFRYAGHTEYLGAKASPDFHPQMILFDDNLRVALVTTHLPLADVPGAITKESVSDSISRLAGTLCRDFGCSRPKIAVLSLNPHCGDGGLLGSEEKERIIPAIADCEEKGILAFGPYAADGFFGTGSYRNFDGVLAMYHDQGLAPFKALAAERGVNFTAGLPFVRTSPDHGTAFDIAWKGVADPSSMREAVYRAIDIFRCREQFLKASANPLRHQHGAERPKKKDQSKGSLPEKQDRIGKEEDSDRTDAVEKIKKQQTEQPGGPAQQQEQ